MKPITGTRGAAEPTAKSFGRGTQRTASVKRCPLCATSDAKIVFRALDHIYGIPGPYLQTLRVVWTVFQDPMVIAEDLPLRRFLAIAAGGHR